MRKAYRILANIIAIEVVIQAMAIVFAIAGFFNWIDDGNSVDEAKLNDDDFDFPGLVGFIIHGINGQLLIPLLGLVLLIIAFFAKIPGGVKWAAIVFGSIIVQVLAGIFAHETRYLGLLHGLNAFILFGSAMMAARTAGQTTEAVEPARV
jgi:hypothetical protein